MVDELGLSNNPHSAGDYHINDLVYLFLYILFIYSTGALKVDSPFILSSCHLLSHTHQIRQASQTVGQALISWLLVSRTSIVDHSYSPYWGIGLG